MTRALPPALVLLGPTASGKTPLGRAIEEEGLWRRRCHHLDFGALLRAGAAGEIHLSRSYRHVVRDALAHGRLLEDEEWFVAEALIDHFLEARRVTSAELVVLNGLPRHVGQAEDVAREFAVETVVALEAAPDVLRSRVATNAGGDRSGRDDDEPEAVEARLARFARRTRPLLAHYRRQGTPVLELPVQARTTGAELRARLDAR